MTIKKILATTVVALTMTSGAAFADTVNTIANVVFIVDESGSMSGEQAFLESTVGQLDAALLAAGVTDRSYGVVGFGGGGSGNLGRVVGSGLTNAADAETNLGNLGLGGSIEDGYSGIDFALNNFNYTAGAAINYILVTDEDRDDRNSALTYSSILTSLTGSNILLNAVVNATFRDGNGASALGVDSGGDAYVADGSGGFTTSTGGTNPSGNGNTEVDYVDLALATGGAAWNLNFIDGGGTNLESFTASFIDIKVQEIISQPPTGVAAVPVPAALPLMLAGIGAFGFVARRRRRETA